MATRDDYVLRRRECEEDLEDHLKAIRGFKNIRAVSWGQSMRSRYLFMATYNLLLDDIPGARFAFYNGARITCEVFRIFQNNTFPNLEKKEELPFNALFVNSFLDAILCDNTVFLKEYSRVVTGSGNQIPFNYPVTCAMKYLVLQQHEKAKEYIDQAHQQKYFKLPYKGFSHVLKGILANDVSLVDEGISYRLAFHKKENVETIFYTTSLEATALAKLAMLYGVTPTIKSPFINGALLQQDQTTHRPNETDRILAALAVADRRSGGLWERVLGGFRR